MVVFGLLRELRALRGHILQLASGPGCFGIVTKFRLNSVGLRICASALLLWPAVTAAEPDWSRIGAEAARLLSAYVRIDTQNPPGRTVEAVEFLEPLAREAGLRTERIVAVTDKPILVGRLRGKQANGKPIVLLNHMDVVPAVPAEWSFPPLSGKLEEGMIYGRGTIDMKVFGIVQLLALRLLNEQRIRPEHDIVFLAVPDEEVGGGEGVGWLARHRPELMDAAGVWDEGGFGVADLFPRPVIMISVAEKRALWVRLVAEGPAGHGSRPFPEAAPFRLQQALNRILSSPPPARLNPTTRRAFERIGKILPGARGFAMRHVDNPIIWPFVRSQLQRDPLMNATIRDTVSLTILQAGYKPNVIPERAEAILDCRLLPSTDEKSFLADLERTIGDPGIRIEVIESAAKAATSPTRNRLFKAIESASRRVYPDAVVTPFMTIATTDSRFFRQRKVPAYGLIPVVLPQELIATAHGVDERIPVETLGPAVRVVYEALRQM